MLAIIIISALLYLFWLLPKSKMQLSNYLGFIAWVLHAAICFYNLFDENGWKLNIVNTILLVSWLSVMIVFIFKTYSQWVKIPLVIFVLLSFILLDLDSILTYHHYKDFSWQLDLHVSLSMLSYSVLSVATLYAVSLWVHIKRIKNPNSVTSSGVISLIEEEKKLFHIIFLGWLILSTSLISGVIFIDNFMEQHLGHKVVFSILAWIIFGILILGRMTRGWRGEKLITLAIMGMTLLATGYLGSKVVLEWLI